MTLIPGETVQIDLAVEGAKVRVFVLGAKVKPVGEVVAFNEGDGDALPVIHVHYTMFVREGEGSMQWYQVFPSARVI